MNPLTGSQEYPGQQDDPERAQVVGEEVDDLVKPKLEIKEAIVKVGLGSRGGGSGLLFQTP